MDLARQRLADMMEEAKNRRPKAPQDTTESPAVEFVQNTENLNNEETTIKKGVRNHA